MVNVTPGQNTPCTCGSGKKYRDCCQVESASSVPASTEFSQLVGLFNAGRYSDLEIGVRALLEQHPDSGLAWKLLSASLQMQGKNAQAALQKAVLLLPDDIDARINLANVLHDQGELNGAVENYRRALEIAPDFAEVHNNLGAALQDLGQFDQAIASYRKALAIQPDYAEAHSNMGNAFKSLGRLDDAVSSYRRALELEPDFADAHFNLGVAFKELGRLDDAVSSYRRALTFKPSEANTHYNLGNAYKDLGRYHDAVTSYRQALALKPDFAEAHNNLGTALQDIGQFDDAAASFRRALEINPDFVDAHNNLGNALKDLGRFDEALASYRHALKINPDFADAYNNLGCALNELGQQEEAMACYRRALSANPAFPEAYKNIGVVLGGWGVISEALEYYLRALEIKPTYLEAWRAYLGALLCHPVLTVDESFEKHITFAAHFGSFLHEINRPFTNQRNERKKLRIGYVSSDFRNHPVGRNTQPLIAQHDRSKVEVYLYGHVKVPDGMTEWFKCAADAWRSIAGLDDRAVAEMIRRDEIDILVLLAGRFDDNRPLIATYRAAPVQVSFHDPATSGLKAMDYLVTDHMLSPADTQEKFTERLIRLPTFYVHPPLASASEVSLLPARERGYVTFGSFNNPAKLNEQVVGVWSRVLHSVPGSQLVLKYQGTFSNKSVRQRYQDLFMAHGIEANRINLLGATDTLEQHMALYSGIDIALDPFPFTGSTTTFEALWMGVPVVTLLGDRMVARWSGAMLKKLSLDELIANDDAEYVEIALGLAKNLDILESLRAGLRERIAHSPLCDERGRTRQIERVFRWMWAKWCADQGARS